MNKRALSFVAFVILIASSTIFAANGAIAKPVVLIDDWQRSITLDDQVPLRIVSLAPHATELIVAAGLLKQLVAVDTNSDFPPAVKTLPKLSSYPRIEIESVINQRPNLLVVWGAGLDRSLIDRLNNYGVAVFVSEPNLAADIVRNIEQLAKLSTNPDDARRLIANWQQRLKSLEAQYASKQKVSYFYQIWQQPLIAMSDQSFQAEASRICGGANIFAQGFSAAPQTDIEAIITQRPQVWLAPTNRVLDAKNDEAALAHRDAIKTKGFKGIVLTLDDAQLQRPGPRWLDGVATFCAALDRVR